MQNFKLEYGFFTSLLLFNFNKVFIFLIFVDNKMIDTNSMMIYITPKHKKAFIAVSGSLALGYLIYKAIKSFEVGGQGQKMKKVRGNFKYFK